MMRKNTATAHKNLLCAVVTQAVEDLTSIVEEERFEAHQFIWATGSWAESRKLYFDLLGLDEKTVQDSLMDRFDPPERKPRSWTLDDVLAVLPPTEFKAVYLRAKHGITRNRSAAILQRMVAKNMVKRTGLGTFIRADLYDLWHKDVMASIVTEQAQADDAHDKNRVLTLPELLAHNRAA